MLSVHIKGNCTQIVTKYSGKKSGSLNFEKSVGITELFSLSAGSGNNGFHFGSRNKILMNKLER